MALGQAEHGPLLVHDPEVEAVVGVGPSDEEMVVYYIYGICVSLWAPVEELAVLVDLPEDHLAVEAATDDSVSGVLVQVENIGDMAIVRVHVHHLANVPYFQRPVIARCVELIVLFVEFDACDCVPMAHEGLDLLLVMDVPDADDSVLAAADHVLSIW